MALVGNSIGRIAQVVVAIGISVGLGWYVWSQVELKRLTDLLATVPVELVAAMLATYLLYQVLRAWRFRIIFPSATRRFSDLIATVCVQGAIAVILPLWLGEVAIIALLRHRHAVQVGRGTAGALFARGIDLLLQAALFVAALVVYRDVIPQEVFRYAGPIVVFLALPVIGVTSLVIVRRRLAANVRGWASEQLALAAAALAEILHRHVMIRFLTSTILMWAAMFLFFHFVLVGLAVSGGLVTTWFVYSMLLPVSSIPIKGIADFGTHEAAWYILLRMLDMGAGKAAAVAFGSHVLILLAVMTTFVAGLAGLALGRSKPAHMAP